jgi:nucleoside phosphorylase
MFVCAGKSEQFDFATPIGIGLVEAAIGTTRLCIEERPAELVFVGTAGSYGEIGLMEIVETQTATNIENGFFEGKTFCPIETTASFASDVSRETIVNSSTYITQDTLSAHQYLRHGIALENMELYAVFKVAQAYGIPARGILIVTNYCDPNAHEEFLAHHAEAMERLTQYIRKHHA